jgi:hypothetical protein
MVRTVIPQRYHFFAIILLQRWVDWSSVFDDLEHLISLATTDTGSEIIDV